MVLAGILCDTSKDSWNFASYLRELAYRGVLGDYLPEIKACYGFKQQNKNHAYDVFEHILNSISHIDNSILYLDNLKMQVNSQEYKFLLQIILLLHDIGKPYCFKITKGAGTFYDHEKQSETICKPIIKKLNLYNGAYNDTIILMIRKHMTLLKLFEAKEVTIKKMISEVGKENIPYLIGVTYCDLMGGGIPDVTKDNLEKLKILVNKIIKIVSEPKESTNPSLCINGEDIAKLGFKGREIGQLLEIISNHVYTTALVNERTELINFAIRYRNNM